MVTLEDMGELQVYATVARLAFRRQSTYRGAMLASLVANITFGYLTAALMRAVVAERKLIDGWNARDFVTFTFAVQAMIGVVSAFGEKDLAQRVMTGDIATDLTRPVRLEGWTIAQFYGKSFAGLLVRTVPTFAAGFVAFDLRLPSFIESIASVIAVLLAIFVAASFWMVVNLTAFWIVNARGTIHLATILGVVFSGMMFSLVLLSPATEKVARWLPWASEIQLPVEVFMGKHSTFNDLMYTYLHQLVWCVVLIWLARIMIARGRRKLVVQGG
jgi:ABC-2 type transport system permease protein